MLNVPAKTETLAHRLAPAKGVPVEDAIHSAVEASARAAGLSMPRRRLTIEQMLAVGEAIAAAPLLDARSTDDIVNDLNAT